MYYGDLSVAQHLRRCSRHLLKRFNGLFGLVLLIHAQNGVDDDDEKDDDNIREALSVGHGEHAAYGGRAQQDYYHRICKLLKKLLYQGVLFCFLQLILSVCLKPPFGLCLSQTVFRTVYPANNLRGILAIILHEIPPNKKDFYGI